MIAFLYQSGSFFPKTTRGFRARAGAGDATAMSKEIVTVTLGANVALQREHVRRDEFRIKFDVILCAVPQEPGVSQQIMQLIIVARADAPPIQRQFNPSALNVK